MQGNTEESNVVYRECLTDGCDLVITRKNWSVQFEMETENKEKEVIYQVESKQIPEFLGDLKKNLNLYLEMKAAGKPHTKDGEGAADMIIRFAEDKPGVYLHHSYWIAASHTDYDRVESLMKKAVDRANKINETL